MNFLFLVGLLWAQDSVNVIKSSTITATTANLRCTVTTSDSGSHVSVYCYSNNLIVYNATATILGVTDRNNGAIVNYGYKGDSITGMFWRPANGAAIQWQVVANSEYKEGTF